MASSNRGNGGNHDPDHDHPEGNLSSGEKPSRAYVPRVPKPQLCTEPAKALKRGSGIGVQRRSASRKTPRGSSRSTVRCLR
jgi:hypothetical protein